MRNCSYLSILFLSLLLVPLSVQAHHSTAIYDTQQEIAVEGVVTGLRWANPHVYIYLDQTTDSGEVFNWEIEGYGPGAMRKMGWSRDSITIGDTLTVNGNPARNPRNKSLYPQTILYAGNTLFDGRQFFAQALSGVTPETATDGLGGTWSTLLAQSLIPFLAGEGEVDLTEEGVAAVARWDEQTMNPGISCTQLVAPPMMIMPDGKRITLGNETITIEGDYDGIVRTIHMNVITHEGASPSPQGHSIGRWEGDSLVIDTRHFSDHIMGNGWSVPSGSQKHLMERLTLNEDGKSLTYHFELMDPQYLASPITGDTSWSWDPVLQFMVDECDLGSARRFLEH